MLKAVDVGFGRVKALNGEQITFPSVVGDFRPVRFTSGMEGKNWAERICVDYNGEQYFIGDIAFQQSHARVTMNSERFTDDEGMVLMLTALMFLAEEKQETIKLVTGLPVSEYALRRDAYEKALLGDHEIYSISLDGTVIDTYNFEIEEVKILPQPVGSIFDAVLGEEGELVKRETAAGKIGVLDIGRNTVDMARTDALSFVDRQSTSFDDIGIEDVHKELSLELKARLGVSIPPENLEYYIQKGKIKYKGETVDMEDEIETVLESQAEKIFSRVLNNWKDFWELDKIIITGGGAAIMGDYIADAINSPGQVELYDGSQATFSNVSGYLKFAKRAWCE